MNLQNMKYLELLELKNQIDFELLTRTTSIIIMVLVIAIIAIILKEWGEGK